MIRVAIVGTGGIAHSHMEAYRQMGDRCEVVALVDIIPGKAARFITVIYPFGSPSEAASVVLSASFEGEAGAFSEGGSTVKVTVNGKEYTLGYSI